MVTTHVGRACLRVPIFPVRNKRYHNDRIAMQIAVRYGMTYEYKMARRHRLSPIEALEEWDMITPEDYKLFEE